MRTLALVLFGVGFVIFIVALYIAIIDSKASGRFLARRKKPLLAGMGAGWALAIAGIILGMGSGSA